MSSRLHRTPLEILCLIARQAAAGSPTDAMNLARVDKAMFNLLALSSPFRGISRGAVFDSEHPNPVCFTHPQLWADIFHDNFSSSAVKRRSFEPGVDGFACQLVQYCQTLNHLKHFPRDTLQFGPALDPFEDRCLEVIFLMLIECDGKNTWQLERVGAYEYCKAWLFAKLYDLDENGHWVVDWPRDDRYATYAVWNTWLLTTHGTWFLVV